jgi:hypothetical protein
MREHLKLAAQVLTETIDETLSIYEADKNLEAFQQSAGTAISVYSEALRAVQNKVRASPQIRKRN